MAAYTHVGDNSMVNGITEVIKAILVSFVCTFILTFISTFIVGCICGICFNKKCKRLLWDESDSNQTTGMYEEAISTDVKQKKQDFELEQNVAYAPISS